MPFHATDCDSDHGDYVRIEHKENKALYKDLIQILVKSEACGSGTAIDIAGFKAAYPDVPHEMSYYKAFFETVRLLAVYAKKRYKEGVKFTFDSRTQSNYTAGLVYGVMVNDTSVSPEDAPIIDDEVSFVSSTKDVRIEVGDLYAREVMKELDNKIGPIKRPRRRSMAALVNTGRFGADLLVREYFFDMRKHTYELEQGDPDMNRHKYVEWLKRSNLPDTMTNRFRFLHFVIARDANKLPTGGS